MDKELSDAAWRVLPAEFREEVKRQYKSCSGSVRAVVIEQLFGIHNLTSDVEGDDEILCVSRKDMQFYYQYYKIKRESESSAEQKAYYKGRTKVLLDLFGSKCLPDEVGNEDNFSTEEPKPAEMTEERYQHLNSLSLEDYDNETSADEQRQFCEYQHKHHPDEVEWLQTHSDDNEPKPAEPKFKFKKGDKVSRFRDEKVYTVDDYCEDDNLNYYILVDSLGNRVTEIEGNLKLYVGPKYHASEKVRYKGQNHEIGEIVQYWGDEDPGRYSVRFGKEYHNISESMLEPYTEATANYLRSEGALNTSVLAGNYSSASTCDKQFDSIIKDGFKNHNRLHIAAMLAAGMLASEVRCYPVDRALELADKLIAECEKGDNNA